MAHPCHHLKLGTGQPGQGLSSTTVCSRSCLGLGVRFTDYQDERVVIGVGNRITYRKSPVITAKTLGVFLFIFVSGYMPPRYTYRGGE